MLLWGCKPEDRRCAHCARRFSTFQGSDERFCRARCEKNSGKKMPSADLFDDQPATPISPA